MPEPTERLKTVTARVETATVAFLDELAAGQKRDRSFVINEALEQYIAHRRWMIEEIKKAVAEADAGDFLSDEESEVFMQELAGR
jgi:predicted transcriptional regulator